MDTVLSDRDRELCALIAARLREKGREERAATEERRGAAMAEARSLAGAFAAAEPGLRRATLFGSVLPGRRFRMDSDIDIAVEGGSLSAMLDLAERSSFRVDLLAVEDMDERFAEIALSEGIVLHERIEK